MLLVILFGFLLQINSRTCTLAMSKTLYQPALKFFTRDLQTCMEVHQGDLKSPAGDSGKLKDWQLKLKGKSVTFSITWVQGVVVQVF